MLASILVQEAHVCANWLKDGEGWPRLKLGIQLDKPQTPSVEDASICVDGVKPGGNEFAGDWYRKRN